MKGGFPEVWVKNYDPVQYLSTLFDSVILKDIVKRYHVRYPNALIDLAQTLITNITGEFSNNAIQKMANFNSSHTAAKYLGYLEEALFGNTGEIEFIPLWKWLERDDNIWQGPI